MKITFQNKFHNTQVTLNVHVDEQLSNFQLNKLEDVLCGMDDCNCNFYPIYSIDEKFVIHQSGYVHNSVE